MATTTSRLLISIGLGAVLLLGTGCANEERDCTAGDTRAAEDGCNTCTCDDSGTWSCTEIACEDDRCVEGQIRPAGDGCNTCSCTADGMWACTLMGCEPDPTTCRDGDTRPAPDGCNTCSCFAGSWACTEMACAPSDACSSDADCMVTGCSGQVCAASDVATDCAWTDAYACYADPAITSCGCQRGQCAWEPTAELEACLSPTEPEICSPGATKPVEAGCGTCACTEDGQWICTRVACEPTCVEGEAQMAPDGCNTCVCTDDGSWACTRMACVPDPAEACSSDSDCVVTGCSGQICAATDVASTCEFLPAYACYADEAITSCGCVMGACAWAATPELQTCLDEAGAE